MIEARSQYLPEYELDLNTPTKLGLAFKICLEFTLKKFPAWPVKELTILSDYLDVKELRQHIDLVLHVRRL